MDRPRMRVTSAVLGSKDPRALASFYERLLGWTRVVDEPARPGMPPEDAWVMLRSGSGSGLRGLSFQYEPDFVAPVWPAEPGQQAMMIHLDIEVDDLVAATDWAVEAGARLAVYQPQDGVRVLLDPAGHPFCLFRAG
ncbi:MAG TPA: VOC family protein [Micromonosporaceae bacterium]